MHLLNCGLHCTHTHGSMCACVCLYINALPTLLAVLPPSRSLLLLIARLHRHALCCCRPSLQLLLLLLLAVSFSLSFFVIFLSLLRACKPTPAAVAPLALAYAYPPFRNLRHTQQHNAAQRAPPTGLPGFQREKATSSGAWILNDGNLQEIYIF